MPRWAHRAFAGAVVGVVLIVVTAAAVDAVRSRSDSSQSSSSAGQAVGAEELQGPDSPPPGVLEGTLAFATRPDCRVQAVDLAAMTIGEPGPGTSCRIWPAPSTDYVVVSLSTDPDLIGVNLALTKTSEPTTEKLLGLARSQPVWSPDGRRVAWCNGTGDTIVLEVETEARTGVRGCYPAFLADGATLTRELGRTSTLLRDGEEILDGEDLSMGFESGRTVTRIIGHGATPDGEAIVVATQHDGRETHTAVQVWSGEGLEASLPVLTFTTPIGPGAFGMRVLTSPAGNQVAIVFPGLLGFHPTDQILTLVDLETEQVFPLSSLAVQGLAWSPDGAWLALSGGDSVEIYGAERSQPVYVLPLVTETIAWR